MKKFSLSVVVGRGTSRRKSSGYMAPKLKLHGFSTEVAEDLAVFDDEEKLRDLALILP